MTKQHAQHTITTAKKTRGKLEIENLRISYGNKEVLNIPRLTFPENKITALVGATSSGKSTLLRQIAGLNRHIPNCSASGHIHLDGQEIPLHSDEGRRGIVFLPQRSQLYAGTVEDNLGAPLSNLELAQWIDVLGLEDIIADHLDRPIEQLSVAYHRAILILRLLMQRPSVLLLDEPVSDIAPTEETWMLRTIHRLSSRLTVIFIAHNKFHAHKASDYVALINHGTLAQLSPTHEFFRQPASAPDQAWATLSSWSVPHWSVGPLESTGVEVSFRHDRPTDRRK